MKKVFLTVSMIFAFAVCAQAQTRPRYALDNFSSSNVTVSTAAKPSAPQAKGAPKQLVKKTVQRTAGVADSYALADSPDMGTRPALTGKGSAGSGFSLRGNSTGSAEIDAYILDSCARYAIDPLLIFAQMNQESSFKLRALSNKGASGLMQLMPATARRFGVTDIYDPQQNIEGGVKYMRWLLDTFNQDLQLALAGYNAGEGAVMKYGWEIPPYNETQNYVRRIMARYEILRGPYSPYSTRTATSTGAKPLKSAPAPVKNIPAPVEKKPAISMYEASVIVVKTADGKMQLMNKK